ncbi:hypothetical protein ACYFX5_09260 [Bremerella sp. T1]|uniref:hypothetical protein n=1 Tax=Bremerella sp. TYQ1 TaxID=3119568 RepID=UPI001CCC7AD7|nr:hypothetical protein [Bremerella volcania]UBM38441.1 hypothetical protein LA756_11200 [Bremerella volcania]
MSDMALSKKIFSRVAVIDDDLGGRNTYKLAIEDMDCTPVVEDGPLDVLDSYVANLRPRVDAAFCDYHLKKHGNYAVFDGDELASSLYLAKVPVVLCTKYTDWEASLLRRRRRYIPRVISYDEAEPENILEAFNLCVREFRGEFIVPRRPWRALVRIEDFEDGCSYAYAVVPAWDTKKRIRLQISDCPSEVVNKVKQGEQRFHAQVNLGAESDEDLYFSDWEI